MYFGGVSALTPLHYLKMNGFPNNYWGWGGEDDDIGVRWASCGSVSGFLIGSTWRSEAASVILHFMRSRIHKLSGATVETCYWSGEFSNSHQEHKHGPEILTQLSQTLLETEARCQSKWPHPWIWPVIMWEMLCVSSVIRRGDRSNACFWSPQSLSGWHVHHSSFTEGGPVQDDQTQAGQRQRREPKEVLRPECSLG